MSVEPVDMIDALHKFVAYTGQLKGRAVATAAVALRTKRREIMSRNLWSLRRLYRAADLEGSNPLKDSQAALDEAVASAYGTTRESDALAFLLELNRSCASREANGEALAGPGLPPAVIDREKFVSDDWVRMPR